MERKLLLVILCLFLLNIAGAMAQSFKVTGTIIDKNDNQPVIGAFVYLSEASDSTKKVATTTDVDGKFTLANLKRKNYKLTIQSINYQRYDQPLNVSRNIDLGNIVLEMESKVLKEVVVVGQGTAVQKGDTTVMTAESFKVTQDANAEDLVKKMPGITVENGTIKARGEDVGQVLVDGKPFFGDDPSVALRNLPAEVIDRVQVYNRLSDQAELTGFDDGNSTRTINIITKRGAKYSSFGKFTGGTDFDSKYLAGGTLNLFSGPRRFTFTGMTNNINQANFAMQDLIGSTSGGGNRGGWGGRQFGGWGGISKNSSLGFNYIDNWGKKIQASGSYFYNTSSTTRITNSNTEYLLINDGKFQSDSSYSFSKNQNHRINMRIEYTIDSMNSMIIVPRFSLQDNMSQNSSLGQIWGGSIFSNSDEDRSSDNLGYNIGNDLTWRHKFAKKGRTLSVRSSFSIDRRNNETTDLAKIDSIYDDQFIDDLTKSFDLNTNLNYTEPLGKKSQLQVNLNNRFRRGDNSREVYKIDRDEAYNLNLNNRMDSLSNVFDSDYITTRGGLSYLYKNDKLNLSAGFNYERADLEGTQTFPIEEDVKKSFQNILPNFMINYKFSDITNLRIFYRTDTDAPSISELQNAVNNSNRRRLSTGNPRLKQEYEHNLIARFSYANPTSGFNTFIFMRGAYATDIITRKTIYAEGDTLFRPDNIDVMLLPGSQISYPVNLDHSYQFNSMVNVSYFFKPIKSNVSLVTGFNYSQNPEFAKMQLNRQNAYSMLNSLIVTSNISENVDFTLSYTSNYSVNKYSLAGMNNRWLWYQNASARLNLIMWKGITFSTDIVGQYNQGSDLSDDYSKKYFVWNASVGKKFLKNNAAELRVGAYDILDQNNTISRSVSPTSIVDSRTNAYRRYFLVLFTYNLRPGKGQGAPQDQKQEPRGYPGGGPPPGMPPGPPPGGFRPGGQAF